MPGEADGAGGRDGGDRAPPTHVRSPRRLLAAALDAMVARSRLPMDPRCRVLLDALLDAAAERMARDDAAALRDAEALVNLRAMFDDLVQQSRILRFDALHAPAVVGALERLCPSWPFCT